MLALDEPRETDAVTEEKGYDFCMDKTLLEKAAHVTIDYSYMGFSVTSASPLGAGEHGACAI